MTTWKIDGDSAEGKWIEPYYRETSIELAPNDDAMTVAIQTGSGYLSQSVSTPIPVRVLVALLRNAGYHVTSPNESEEPK